jgi:ribosomal protein L21E
MGHRMHTRAWRGKSYNVVGRRENHLGVEINVEARVKRLVKVRTYGRSAAAIFRGWGGALVVGLICNA